HLLLAHRLHLRLWARLLGRPRRGRHLDRLLALARDLRDAIDLALPPVDRRRGGRRRTPHRTRQGAVTEAYLCRSSALCCQDPWSNICRSRVSASAGTASPRRRPDRSTCPIRCRAKPPRSTRGPAILTAVTSSASRSRARTGSRRSVRISAPAAAARCSTGRPRIIANGNVISSLRRWRGPASTRRLTT